MTDTTLPAVPATTPTAAPTVPTPTVTPRVEPHSKAGLSPGEAATMAGWIKNDLAKGKISPEQAAKAFDQLGATAEQRAPDTRSEEVKELDQQFPPAKASDYTIRYGLPGQDVPMTQELKQFDTVARTWLSRAGVPHELGNTLVNTIAKTVEHTRAMTPDQLDEYGYREYAKLQHAYGPALEEKLQAAGHMVEALETNTPSLKNGRGGHVKFWIIDKNRRATLAGCGFA